MTRLYIHRESIEVEVQFMIMVSLCVRARVRACMPAHVECVPTYHSHLLVHTIITRIHAYKVRLLESDSI